MCSKFYALGKIQFKLFVIMNRSFLFLVLVACCFGAVKVRRVESPSFFAIKSLVDSQFVSEFGKMDLITCGTLFGPSQTLRNQLLFHKNESLSIKLKSCDSKILELDSPTLMMFDSIEYFAEKLPKIKWRCRETMRLKHLVHVFDASAKDIQDSFENG